MQGKLWQRQVILINSVNATYFGLGQILIYLLKSYVEKNMLNNDSFETQKVMETWRRSWNLVMKFESTNPATNSQNKIL